MIPEIDFFGKKERTEVSHCIFKNWVKVYRKGAAFITISKNSDFLIDPGQCAQLEKNKIELGKMAPYDIVLYGPILFAKLKSQKTPLFNLFMPNYLVCKHDSKSINLVPIPDILECLIKIRFNDEKNQKIWYKLFNDCKKVNDSPTIPIPFPLCNNSTTEQHVATIHENELIITDSNIEGITTETKVRINSSFIIASPFELDTESNNFCAILISASKTNYYVLNFDDIDGLFAAYCDIYLASRMQWVNHDQRMMQIYQRQKRFEGIVQDFHFSFISNFKEPTPKSLAKVQTKSIKFSAKSALPAVATTNVKIVDFKKPIHRSVIFAEYREIRQHSMFNQSSQIPACRAPDEVFDSEKQQIMESLDKLCFIEEKDWKINAGDVDDDVFAFKESSASIFFNKGYDELNDISDGDNHVIDSLLEANDLKLSKDDSKLLSNELLRKLEEILANSGPSLSLESKEFMTAITLIANAISDTADYNSFPSSLLWIVGNSQTMKKCFPSSINQDFERLMVTFVARLSVAKKLGFLIETISSELEWRKDVYEVNSLMNSSDFFPKFTDLIKNFEDKNFTGTFRLPATQINFMQIGSRRIDILIQFTTSEILKYFHSGKEAKDMYELVARLLSSIAKFLNLGFYREGTLINAWSLFLKTDMFGIRTNELTIMQETIKRAEKTKLTMNAKIAVTIFTAMQLNIAPLWIIYFAKGAKKLGTHREDAPIFNYTQMSIVAESFHSLASIKLEIPDTLFDMYPSLF